MDITLPEVGVMTDIAMWALIVGFVQPLVLDLLMSSRWSKRTQSLVAFGFSAVVGVITALLNGSFNGLTIVSSVLLVAVVSISAYRGFWSKVAPNLKEVTSPGRHADR